ncbi:MAG: PEP-CTERM sorting domain-containing protein [Myxococcales bacterium]|nr:PEP-CTERM sorting domain-containing protein [Myxococcales bacterium]
MSAPAEAITLCAFRCPVDPSTPAPVEVEWNFVLATAVPAGGDLSLGVVGNVYVYSSASNFTGETLTLAGAEIVILGATSITLIADVIDLSNGGPDGSEDESVTGDVYVALDPPFGDLLLAATGQVFLTDQPLSFVPEPRPVGLLALGLIAGARLRRHLVHRSAVRHRVG